MMTTAPDTERRRLPGNQVAGLVLILAGLAFLVIVVTDLGGELILVGIGLGFLVAYLRTRAYGLLIPGAILTGLGTGVTLAANGLPGELVLIGLGGGFLAIALVDLTIGTTRPGWWWPFIPGGILTTVGASTLGPLEAVGRFALPAVLIAIGVVLLVGRRGGGDS